MKITIIDNNLQLSRSIRRFFEKQWDSVKLYHSRSSFMEETDISADVYIIDISLEDGNGLDITRYLRNIKHIKKPILMISGHQELNTKLEWFEIGADDYIVKPFSPLELDARVKSILSRMEWEIDTSHKLTYKDIVFDTLTRRLTNAWAEVELSKKGKQITELFMKNKWVFISKEILINSVWWPKNEPDNIQNTINVSICKVRKKLWADFNLVTINSEWYILEN